MKTSRHIYILTLSMFMLFACKKEQAELADFNKNCSCAEEVSAEFSIVEDGGGIPSFPLETETDTIFKNRYVIFTAEQDGDYTWYLGAEIITEKSFSRLFDASLVGQDIPVTLVVSRTPNNICFPDDDGYDSITKILHVSQFPVFENGDWNFGSIEGNYRMKSDHLLDSFDVDFDVSIGAQTIVMFNITNFDGEGSNCLNQARVTGSTYRRVWSVQNNATSPTQCKDIQGYIHNRLDSVTEMKFTIREYENNPPQQGDSIITTQLLYLGRKL